MIYLIIFSYLNFAFAKQNYIAESEISQAICQAQKTCAFQPGVGSKECSDSDPCHKFGPPNGIIWEAAVFSKGVLSNDPAKLEALQIEREAEEIKESQTLEELSVIKEKLAIGEQKLSDEEQRKLLLSTVGVKDRKVE